MTQPNSNPDRAEEIRLGVANACLMMPGDSAKRAEEINRLHHLTDEEKDAVAEAKEQIGVSEHAKRLKDVYGIVKPTLAIMKILDKVKKHGDRAAVITQVNLLSKDVGYVDKDLVTLAQEAEATAGQGAGDQGSVFDSTTTGQRQGGTAAQPRTTEEMAASNTDPAPTPGIPLDEALQKLEAYCEANPPRRGAKTKELKKLKADVDHAQRAHNLAVTGTADGKANLADLDPVDGPETESHYVDQPASETISTTEALREANAAGDAHIREQVQQHEAPSDVAPPAAPKRGRKAVPVLDDELPPPAPRKADAARGLGPDAYH